MLQSGGNAVDAAITAAAVLAVVEPTMTGVGGDVFAIVYDARTRGLHGLNSSGRAGSHADADALLGEGQSRDARGRRLPDYGAGRGRGLGRALAQHGSITLARALEPAIGYARDGFSGVGDHCRPVGARPQGLGGSAAAAVFLPGGRAPGRERSFAIPICTTLEQIPRWPQRRYQGPIGDAIAPTTRSGAGS